MDHSDSVGLVATTVAHEMGHNFGMEHDTEEDCKCPDKRCIMAPSSGLVTHYIFSSFHYIIHIFPVGQGPKIYGLYICPFLLEKFSSFFYFVDC